MIGLFVVMSELEQQEIVRERVNHLIREFGVVSYVRTILEAEDIISQHREEISGSVILVASGGTEALINQIVYQNAGPTLLWANPERNSLPAAIEAYAALKSRFPMRILYSELDSEDAHAEIRDFISISDSIKAVDSAVLGCIGTPSPWLLTSHGVRTPSPFETEFRKIRMEELTSRLHAINADAARSMAEELQQQFLSNACTENDLMTAAKLSLALRDIIEEFGLSAVTIRCFDLLPLGYTACLAVSKSNDWGIVAGCEGDLESVLSMMVIRELAKCPSWMANPVRLDKENNTLTLAHCTIPISMLANRAEARLMTHMESDLGVAIQGALNKSEMTLIRLGDRFQSMLIASGKIIDTDMRDSTLCRIQAVVRLDGSVATWLERAPGNHHILVYGNLKDRLVDFCTFKGISPVVI